MIPAAQELAIMFFSFLLALSDWPKSVLSRATIGQSLCHGTVLPRHKEL